LQYDLEQSSGIILTEIHSSLFSGSPVCGVLPLVFIY
jgi:hypothetical protein